MIRTGATYPLIALLAILVAVISACTDSSSGESPSARDLCLVASDCEGQEVCGPSGECVRAPRYLKHLEDPTEAEQQLLSLWNQWGTVGTQTGNTAQAHDHAFCTVSDVLIEDLGADYDAAYPDGYWGDQPREEEGARCGDDDETLAWRLLNCERMSYGVEPVSCDERLVWLGRQHANDMADREFFDHVNPDSRDPFDRMDGRGIDFELAGENLARVQSVESAHRAWMASEVHRRTLLTAQFTHGGVGIVRVAGQLLLAQELTRPPGQVGERPNQL